VRRHVRSPFFVVALALGLFAAAVWFARTSTPRESYANARQYARVGCAAADDAFHRRRSGQWLTVSGTVKHGLSDAYGRYQHQRFILQCLNGMTILIVNDVGVGRRVPIANHAQVAVRGQYVWDRQGGLVHFTHHGNGGEPGGWILYGFRLFQ